jgi:hypothetical protein
MTRKWSATLIPLLFVRVLLGFPPAAGETLDGPIAKGSKATYADLLRLICPDLKVDTDDPSTATATKAVAIRYLDQAAEGQPQEDSIIKVGSARTIAVVKGRALVTFIMPISQAIPERAFAVFDLGSTPKLVDVVGVPQFPDDAGDYSQALSLNDSTEAYVFDGHHFNSQQGYDGYTILFVRGDRVEQIEALGTLSCRGCASASFDESVDLSTTPDPGHDYNKILIRVTFKQLAENHHRPFTRYYSAEYRWDAQAKRFVTLSKALKELRDFNHKNY